MASMRDGSGNDLFIAFGAAGTFLKGLHHECPMAPAQSEGRLWPGIYGGLPVALHEFRDEPAFSRDDASYCMWWPSQSDRWHVGVRKFADGRDPDGSEEQLAIYDGNPSTYAAFARDYFEVEPPLELLVAVYEQRPLTAELVAGLNADANFDAVAEETTDWPYGA